MSSLLERFQAVKIFKNTSVFETNALKAVNFRVLLFLLRSYSRKRGTKWRIDEFSRFS